MTLEKKTFSQNLARLILKLMTWELELTLPPVPKYVLVGAPHTSNWDLLFALLLMYAAGVKPHWIGKASLFRSPVGWLLKKLGGVPVMRESRNDFVTQMVHTFNSQEQYIVAIAPEGTRSKTDYWKTGFYYIALGAGIPISLGFIDYSHKTVGIGPYFYPTGDIQADFAQIIEFYAGKTGRNPHAQGSIKLRIDTADTRPIT